MSRFNFYTIEPEYIDMMGHEPPEQLVTGPPETPPGSLCEVICVSPLVSACRWLQLFTLHHLALQATGFLLFPLTKEKKLG